MNSTVLQQFLVIFLTSQYLLDGLAQHFKTFMTLIMHNLIPLFLVL